MKKDNTNTGDNKTPVIQQEDKILTNTVFYPKDLANAETNSVKKSINKNLYLYNYDFNTSQVIDSNNLEQFKENFGEKIKKSTISLAGAYPFLFDGLVYICCHEKQAIDNIDNDNYFYSIRIPYKAFLNICLGGKKHLRKIFATELKKLYKDIELKIIPYDDKSLIKTQPIRISYKTTNPESLLEYEIQRLDNLSVCAISEVQIDFVKPLFQCLLKDKPEKYFPAPSAFYACLSDCIDKYKKTEYFQNISNKDYNKSDIRKVFLYVNLHDNSKSDKLSFNALNFFLNCNEQYIENKKNTFYLKSNWYDGYLFFRYSLEIFQKMAEEGLMGMCKFKPSGLWYNKNTKSFELSLIRNKEEYTKKIDFSTQVIE